MRVQDRAYRIRIVFHRGEGKKPDEEKKFHCLIARSPQGAITKAFLKCRARNGNDGTHGNYGCELLTIEVSCLGAVDK